MHSSRMHTARLLPVSPWSGDVYLVPGVCTWSGGVYLVQGGLGPGGAPGPGGVPGRGKGLLCPGTPPVN